MQHAKHTHTHKYTPTAVCSMSEEVFKIVILLHTKCHRAYRNSDMPLTIYSAALAAQTSENASKDAQVTSLQV